eukprot:3853295-Rhodomonas_salina.1
MIIQDGAQGTGLITSAWQMGLNLIIQNQNWAGGVENPILVQIVESAIKLAQRHLQLVPVDYKPPTATPVMLLMT